MMRYYLLAHLLLVVCGQPTGVDVSSTPFQVQNPWTHGQILVSWNSSSPAANVVGYLVSVNPLNSSNTFSNSSDLNDFVLSPGNSANSIKWNSSSGTLDMNYAGGNLSWQQSGWGRGWSPYALRRAPNGATLQLNSIDCRRGPPGATTFACGLAVFDAGANRPLFTWMVGYSAARGSVGVMFDAVNGSAFFTNLTVPGTAAVPSNFTLNGTQLQISRNAASNVWVLSARLAGYLNWTSLLTVSGATAGQPGSPIDAFFSIGDIWYGLGAKAANGSADASLTGLAKFDELALIMPLTAPPVTIWGNADACVSLPPGSGGLITALNATVLGSGASNVSFAGLSSNFPYTATVYSIFSGGALSPPSAPIMGTYFWALALPPRQQALSLAVMVRYKSATAQPTSTFSDSSGNGRTLFSTGFGSPGNNGGNFPLSPNKWIFFRTNQFLLGGADALDFSIVGPMTIYLQFNQNSADSALSPFRELLLGMGAPSQGGGHPSVDAPGGWYVAFNETRSMGISVNDNAGGRTGASTPSALYGPSTSNQNSQVQYVFVISPANAATAASVAAAGPMGRLQPGLATGFAFNVTVCRTSSPFTNTFTTCYDPVNGLGGASLGNFDGASSPSTSAPAGGVTWAPLPNGTWSSSRPIDGNLRLHLGGVGTDLIGLGTGLNNNVGWSGSLKNMLIYREAHSPAQISSTLSWLLLNQDPGYVYVRPIGLSAPAYYGVVYNGGQLPSCTAGLQPYSGQLLQCQQTYGISCYNNAANFPAVCLATCPPVLSPLYAASCTVSFAIDSWGGSQLVPGYPNPRIKYIASPAVRKKCVCVRKDMGVPSSPLPSILALPIFSLPFPHPRKL